MDVPALGEENLAKDSEENNKNWMILLCRVGEREKSWKNFWKSVLNGSNTELKKKLIHDIRLIEKQFRLIEIDKDPLEFFIAISIDRKTDSINRNCKKMNFWKSTEFDATSPQSIEKIWKKMYEYEMNWFSQTQDLKPNFPKNLDFKQSPFFFFNQQISCA